jgi:hypothetical protein
MNNTSPWLFVASKASGTQFRVFVIHAAIRETLSVIFAEPLAGLGEIRYRTIGSSKDWVESVFSRIVLVWLGVLQGAWGKAVATRTAVWVAFRQVPKHAAQKVVSFFPSSTRSYHLKSNQVKADTMGRGKQPL